MTNVGIIGFGLIGGSVAKAYRRDPNMHVYGMDADQSIMDFACAADAIEAPLTDDLIGQLDLPFELDTLGASLQKYRDAIADNDMDTLLNLLDEGRRIKEEVDG